MVAAVAVVMVVVVVAVEAGIIHATPSRPCMSTDSGSASTTPSAIAIAVIAVVTDIGVIGIEPAVSYGLVEAHHAWGVRSRTR